MKKKIKTSDFKIFYWDANCHIALLSAEPTTNPVYLASLETTFHDMMDGKVNILSCTLLQVEVFPKPEHKHIYEDLMSCPHFSLVETVSSVFALAGELREKCKQSGQSLKAPDAIHIAAGHLARVDEIWTTDKSLVNKSNAGLLVETPVVYPHVDQVRMVFGEDE